MAAYTVFYRDAFDRVSEPSRVFHVLSAVDRNDAHQQFLAQTPYGRNSKRHAVIRQIVSDTELRSSNAAFHLGSEPVCGQA